MQTLLKETEKYNIEKYNIERNWCIAYEICIHILAVSVLISARDNDYLSLTFTFPLLFICFIDRDAFCDLFSEF